MTAEVGSDRRSSTPHATSTSTSDETSSTTSDHASRGPSSSERRSASRRSSRSQSQRPEATRVHSAAYLDDHALYHSHEDSDHREEAANDEEEDGSSLDATKIETVEEVRGGIVNERDVDLEKSQAPVEDLEQSRTLRSTKSRHGGKLVTWDGPDDPENPKNWPTGKKWAATLTVSMFTFISPVSSSMVAPALSTIASQFNVTDQIISQLMLSIFILAYAVGPLILGPLSEIYGRAIVLQLANAFFLVFNVGCAVSQNKTQLIVCRFFSGLGGSAPLGHRWCLAPLLGPALGPVAGGFIAENTSWRWVFYSVSIADALVQFMGLFLLRETYGPRILRDRAKRIRKETGDPSWKTEAEMQKKTLTEVLSGSLVRPFRLLLTQSIVQVVACYMAYIYGLMYLVLSTFPVLWTSKAYYNESIGIGGLNYISLGLGFFLGSQICAPLNDRIYRRLKATNNGVGRPEFRVPLMGIGAFLVPVGLFIYGWTAQTHCHWIAPNIGTVLFAAGTIISFQCMQTYMVDAYTRYAASALAASSSLRSLAGFGFPLFAPYMYNKLHYGWGNSLLAFISIAIGLPAPIFLWKFGEILRKRSTYAAG
ncbi:Efflux pump vrtL [Penicillium diatomitis]|uniref:Efflux pump vrtL n=1 Tax=Penicillium diatomitis TaxID=2819901 RepID=A0A9W9WKY7_9EURO|nr:Efflux pump vrtL [Penicillium diatomitis]KAJ5469346.1 Efflux pump vrtL [Penicillium diatomitis]